MSLLDASRVQQTHLDWGSIGLTFGFNESPTTPHDKHKKKVKGEL